MTPASHGPIPWPIRVCNSSRSDVATDRILSVAIACVIANDGPKNTAAMNVITPNIGSTMDMSGARYATNVPTPPTRLKIEIQYPACDAVSACERWKNALLNAPEAYHTTECNPAAR